MQQRSGIYCIRNITSGRQYVGSACNVEQRWHSHRSLLNKVKHHSPALQRSWLKHGPEAFVFELLELVADPGTLLDREQYWINELKSSCPKTGFNVSPTAGSPLGVKHSLEARMRQSIMRKGRKRAPFTAEHRAAMSRAAKTRIAFLIARNKTDGMREKVSAWKRRRDATPEGLELNRQAALIYWNAIPKDKRGRPHSEAAKLKISLAKKGKMTSEHKAAIAASNKSRAML
jgi:group I intron endonuclease